MSNQNFSTLMLSFTSTDFVYPGWFELFLMEHFQPMYKLDYFKFPGDQDLNKSFGINKYF